MIFRKKKKLDAADAEAPEDDFTLILLSACSSAFMQWCSKRVIDLEIDSTSEPENEATYLVCSWLWLCHPASCVY